MSFSLLLDDLYQEVDRNKTRLASVRSLVRLFNELNAICNQVGSRHRVELVVSIFDTNKMLALDRYGRENITVVVDKFRNRFPIPKEVIKEKARSVFKDAYVSDAIAYENNEGVKIFFKEGRIDVLPGSFHIWRVIDDDVVSFCNWLMDECYKHKLNNSNSNG